VYLLLQEEHAIVFWLALDRFVYRQTLSKRNADVSEKSGACADLSKFSTTLRINMFFCKEKGFEDCAFGLTVLAELS
jgi:hypothetical protein